MNVKRFSFHLSLRIWSSPYFEGDPNIEVGSVEFLLVHIGLQSHYADAVGERSRNVCRLFFSSDTDQFKSATVA